MPRVYQGDTLRITGTSGAGIRYERVYCMVATVSLDSNQDGSNVPALKVWPMDSEAEGGKIWFEVGNIESAELVERDWMTGKSVELPDLPVA